MDAWTQALLVTPLTIAGVPLRPYSLAHNVVLAAKGSPYVADLPATRQDLFFALQVCSRTLAQIRDSLLGPRPPVWQLLRSGLRWGRVSFEVADASFRTYLRDYRKYPERHESDGKGEIAAPYEWHAARILCREYGVSLTEVWDTPMSIAVCAIDAWTESRGDKGLITRYDKALGDLLKAQGEAQASGAVDEAERLNAMICDLIKRKGGA